MSTGWIDVDRDALINAIEVLNLVPQQAGIPTSDYIRFTLHKDSLEMSLASVVVGMARVPGKFADFLRHIPEFFLDRRLFLPFILAGKKRKAGFRIGFNPDNIFVRQGAREALFAMNAEKVSGYGQWTDISSLKEIKLSQELRNMLLASIECATADPSMPHLNCVYIGDTLVLASNQTVLFVGKSKKASGMKFPFPVGIVPLLSSVLVKGVGVEGDKVILDCGCGFLEGMVSAKTKTDFPRKTIESVVEKGSKWPLLVNLPADRLHAMFGRFIGYLSGVRREDWLVKLEITGKTVKATVKINNGKFDEALELDHPAKLDGTVEWPLDLVAPVIEYMASTGTEISVRTDNVKKTPYLLGGDTVELMVSRKV
jgi:hypothetical protein